MTRISGIRWLLYEYELARPLGDANKPAGVRRRTDLALFLDADDGRVGVAVGSSWAHTALPGLADVVLGHDPLAVRGLWQKMVDATFKVGNQGAVSAAIAAIDCALWDLRAKIRGVPLYKELGGDNRRVRVYASGRDTPLSDDELHAFYARMTERGVRAGKLKVGLDPDADLRRLGVMADAFGGKAARPVLLVDANEYWSPKEAIRRMGELEREFDVVWCEEPARRWDYRGLRQVAQSVRAAVATGENLRDASAFLPLLLHEAVDVVQVGHLTSGITGAMQVAELAAAFDRPVAMMNCPGRFMAHVAAVLPHHLMMEVVEAGRDAVFSFDSTIEDGWLVLGDAPGLGITFDADALERHRVETVDRATQRTFETRGRGAATGGLPPTVSRYAE